MSFGKDSVAHLTFTIDILLLRIFTLYRELTYLV